MNWTEDRIDLLVKLWGEGKSAAQISTEIGGVSRNAVIGKVHRLGIAVRKADDAIDETVDPLPSASNDARRIRTSAAAVRERRSGESLPAQRRPAGILPRRLRTRDRKAAPPGILDLSEHPCRWPVGDPALPGFHFCGGFPVAGRPYCREHMQAAYMPAARNNSERILRQLEKRGQR